MDLRKITFLLIVSFIASFFMRTIGTLFPLIFQNVYAVKVTIVVNTFFIVMHFLFYVSFLREYAAKRTQSRANLHSEHILVLLGLILSNIPGPSQPH